MKDLSDRDPGGGMDPIEPHLTKRQRWRLNVALEACGNAWRELEGHLKDPNNFAILALQELTSAREIATLSALRSVSIPPAESLPTAQHILTSLLASLVPTSPLTSSATASPLHSRPTLATTTVLSLYEMLWLACQSPRTPWCNPSRKKSVHLCLMISPSSSKTPC